MCSPRSRAVSPEVEVSGTVRYPDGRLVRGARVESAWAVPESTFADSLGRYSISLLALGDSVTLVARDGYDPNLIYGLIHYEVIRVLPNRDQARDITLTHSTPL